MRPHALALLLLLPLLGACAAAPNSAAVVQDDPPPAAAPEKQSPLPDAAPEKEEHGIVHGVLLYLPNRIFDVFDIARLRLRLGPGFSLGLRATELLDLEIGGYTSVFAGIRGPRGEPRIPWPVGLENYAGVEVSVIGTDSDDRSRFSPHYGAAEFGLDTQLLIIGFAAGVEPLELVDFVLGFLTIDFEEDDF